ncbi:MAG: glycosyltransferase family 4 protein [Patescibacteria group bacterium]|nr:glycosyltransferase family 4 protein [Patescibacteria group bacterium]MDD4304868.1 glycosyltransferase family 4 protein [Patescibacteria group bacterium]MDD4695774.1 glycosyltransferase family 4 protein [Patescibacteria group bacterium]
MNILQINKFHYFKGGADRHYLELSELLRSNEHNVINFSTKNEKNIESKYSKYFPKYYDLSINANKLEKTKNIIKFFYNYEAVKNLKKLIKENQIDIAHIHNIYHHLSPGILKVLKKNNIPIVMTVHDYKLICPNYNLFDFQKNKVCEKCKSKNYLNCFTNNCIQNSKSKSLLASLEMYYQKIFFPYQKLVDVFIAPSEFMKNKLIEFGFKNKNIIVLHNFENLKSKQSEIKDYFLYFGRLAKEKGLENFIKTLSKIEKDYNFYIAGSGPEENNLKKLVEKLYLEDKIKFLGFYDNNKKKELEVLIKSAQFIVIPSIWYENCSLSILEAMSFSKTILASNIGGNSELVKNDINGILYNNETESIDGLNKLINNKELLEKLGIESGKIINDKFNSELYYKNLINLYQELINK